MKSPFLFPMGVQIILPDQFMDGSFRHTLDFIKSLGYRYIELNVAKPETADPEVLRQIINDSGLKMSNFASGATANAEKLSLTNQDLKSLKNTVERVKDLLNYASCFEAGFIIGFLKGGAGIPYETAKSSLLYSLGELVKVAEKKKVPILLEATNHYEASIAHSLTETVGLISPFHSEYLQVLPDTFHMNIAEKSIDGAISRNLKYFKTIHLSDNNRYFPGYGRFAFAAFLSFLHEIGYQGILTIEGRLNTNFENDLKMSTNFLQSVSMQLVE